MFLLLKFEIFYLKNIEPDYNVSYLYSFIFLLCNILAAELNILRKVCTDAIKYCKIISSLLYE